MTQSSIQAENQCDILVVGGGPAGSTAAALLAEKGWQVTLLEKAHHPRFHVGESLLPMNLPILDRLGVLDQVDEIGIIKHSAEFISDRFNGDMQVFDFKNTMGTQYPYAYEVRRSEFDHLLLKNAASKENVTVLEGVRVKKVNPPTKDSITVESVDEDNNTATWKAKYVVDASGRDTLVARNRGWRKTCQSHNCAAILGHFENVIRNEGQAEGNISIYWFDHGWIWMIPLHDGSTSIGAVCDPAYIKTRKGTLTEFHLDTINLSPSAKKRMVRAKIIGESRGTGNFSYRSDKLYDKRCLLIGDSGAFIDPVFSSGIYLAMNGACMGADAIDQILRDPSVEKQLMRRYERKVRRGLKTFSWFIHRFNTPVMHWLFMNPSSKFKLDRAVTSVLAGDVYFGISIRLRLLLFKAIYYTLSLFALPSALAALRKRKGRLGQSFEDETIMTGKS